MRVFTTAAAIALIAAHGATQPVYGGKTVGEWLKVLRTTGGLPEPGGFGNEQKLTEALRALGTIAPDIDGVIQAILDAHHERLTRPQNWEFSAALARIGPKSRAALIRTEKLWLIDPVARRMLADNPEFDQLVARHFADPLRRKQFFSTREYSHLLVHAVETPKHRRRALQLLSGYRV